MRRLTGLRWIRTFRSERRNSDGVALSDAESLDNADVSLSDPPHADNGTSIVPARIAAISLVSERPLEKTPRVIFEYWRSPAPPELLM